MAAVQIKKNRIHFEKQKSNDSFSIRKTVFPYLINRFATRAKKIENQPKVNEVVSDAVEVKRMKKQISALETELQQHKDEIEKYQKMQNDLDFLNAVTIRSSGVKSAHRRQTWGGDGISMIPVHVDSPCTSKIGGVRDHRATGSLLNPGNDLNDAAKCNGGTQDTKAIDESEWTDAVSAFKVPTKVPSIKRSLLAVSTSFKSPVHRTNCKLIDFAFISSIHFQPKS